MNSEFLTKCQSITQQSLTPKESIDKVFSKKRHRENYSKLNEEATETLEQWFIKTKYPKKEEYEAIAEELQETIPKIENWFKHKRRKYMIEGNFNTYKRRRLLTENEKLILEETFREIMKPSKTKMHQLAKELNFTTKVISNWFSYRRKKYLKVNSTEKKQKIKKTLSGSSSDFSFPSMPKTNTQHQTNYTGPSDSSNNQESSKNKSENSNDGIEKIEKKVKRDKSMRKKNINTKMENIQTDNLQINQINPQQNINFNINPCNSGNFANLKSPYPCFNTNFNANNNQFIQNYNPNLIFNRNITNYQPYYGQMVIVPQEYVLIPIYKQNTAANNHNIQPFYNGNNIYRNGVSNIPHQITLHGGFNIQNQNER